MILWRTDPICVRLPALEMGFFVEYYLPWVKLLWGYSEKRHPLFHDMQRAELYVFSWGETIRLEALKSLGSSSSYQASEQLFIHSSNSQSWLGTILKTLHWETLAAIQDIKKIIKKEVKLLFFPAGFDLFIIKGRTQSLLFHFRCSLEVGTPCTPSVLINQGWPKFSSPKFVLAGQSSLLHLSHHQKGQKLKRHQGQVMCFHEKDPPTLISQYLCLSLTKVGARREERSPWGITGPGCDPPSPGHPTWVTSSSRFQPQQGLGTIWGHKQHLPRKWRKLTKNATLGWIFLTLSKKVCKYH